MSKLGITFGIVVAAASQATAQEPLRPNDELEIPLPISSPTSIGAGPVVPLTPAEKLGRALRNTIGPNAILNRVIITGWDHMTDNPEEWSGNLDGYGHRLGIRMARLAVRQGVQLGAEVALRVDPRYDRCDCSGFWSRTKHAWKRVAVSRRDNGDEMLAVPNFAGAYVPPFVTDRWFPPSRNTWENKWTSGTSFLALRGVSNMLREFWPEVRRALPFKGRRNP